MGESSSLSVRMDEPSAKPCMAVRVMANSGGMFRQAVESAQCGVVITTQPADGDLPGIAYANRVFLELLGQPQDDTDSDENAFVRPESSTLQAHPVWKLIEECHRGNDEVSLDVPLRQANGGERILRFRSEPICNRAGRLTHRICLLRDITHRADLEDVLRRNERLACVGLLAAGIAHEINNPTGSALLAAETALAIMDSSDAKPQLAACLRNIVTSMDRCGRIVRTLLRYSREEATERQACSINDVAKQALELAKPYAERYGATMRLGLDPDVPLAPMNPLEIELVLVNLIRNAVEAGGGSVAVVIRTEYAEGCVRVSVSDNGCGMNEEQLAHVLDPLYTTRRHVGGSGLGMSIAHGLVKGHDGQMEVSSQVGRGTSVTIELPVAPGT